MIGSKPNLYLFTTFHLGLPAKQVLLIFELDGSCEELWARLHQMSAILVP